MIIKEPKYSFCDLQIMPAVITTINSRKECNSTYSNGLLPLFTAPMDSVVDDTNYTIYKDAGINPIIHRNVSLEKRIELTKQGEWCAYSKGEYEKLFCNEDSDIFDTDKNEIYALLDIANGHMKSVLDTASKSKDIAKRVNKKLIVMSGNIANPETYVEYCKAGIDYVRCSIGTGSMCLSSANLGVHMPQASLIDEIVTIKNELFEKYGNVIKPSKHFTYTKIIADGGIKNYSDAITALACGADYVMIGGIFASFLESCADIIQNSGATNDKGFLYEITTDSKYVFSVPRTPVNYTEYNNLITKYNLPLAKFTDSYAVSVAPNHSYDHMLIMLSKDELYIKEVANWIVKHTTLYKSSHGMSTKEAQINGMVSRGETVDKSKLKTSEGKTITNEVKYSVYAWAENFSDYLKSAMSYTNCVSLEEFKTNCTLVVKSQGTMLTVNK